MAGRGPAPKDPSQRRRSNAPERGEWVSLAPITEPVLPPLSEGEWKAATVTAWEAWRADPVTTRWSPADIAFALDTIALTTSCRHPPPARFGFAWTPWG
jgi:hypothetical protein